MNEIRRRPELDELEEEIGRTVGTVRATDPPPSFKMDSPPRQVSSLQSIGRQVTQLTWKQAEWMGTQVQAKIKDGVSVTSAIQAWAEEWEKFDH